MATTRTKTKIYKIGEDLANRSEGLKKLSDIMNEFEEKNAQNLNQIGVILTETNDVNQLDLLINYQWSQIMLNAGSSLPWELAQEISDALESVTKEEIDNILKEKESPEDLGI